MVNEIQDVCRLLCGPNRIGSATRQDEIVAIGQTISILTEDDARDLMSKTTSFMQTRREEHETSVVHPWPMVGIPVVCAEAEKWIIPNGWQNPGAASCHQLLAASCHLSLPRLTKLATGRCKLPPAATGSWHPPAWQLSAGRWQLSG